jgi:hypothetical protein
MDKFVRIIGVLALAMILLFALSVFNSERNGTISNDTFWGFITGICLASFPPPCEPVSVGTLAARAFLFRTT